MTTNGSDSHSMAMETENDVMILSVTDPSEQPLKGPQMVLISVLLCKGAATLHSLTGGTRQRAARGILVMHCTHKQAYADCILA